MESLRKLGILTAAAITAGISVLSCSPARKLAEGQYNLKQNKITVSGSKDVTSSELSAYVKQQPASFSISFSPKPVVFNESLIEKSVDNIKEHLKYLGYYNSRVSSNAEFSRNRNVRVRYDVEPGDRFSISQIRYDLPERGSFAEDFLRDTANVSIKVGDFLSESACEAESERAAAFMRASGYYGFSKNHFFFEADTLSGRDNVTLLIQVKEHTRNENESGSQPLNKSKIGEVKLSYPTRIPFRNKVLRNLNTIHPGSLYNEKDINTTYQRLSALKVFNSVNIELNRVDSTTVNCDMTLGAARIQGANIGLEASTNSSGLMGVSPQISYYHKNFLHGGEWFNLSFLGNFQFRLNDKIKSNEFGVSTGLSLPRFLGIPNSRFKGSSIPRTEIKAAYSYQDRPEYTRSIVSTSYGYSGMAHGHLTYQLYPLQVNVVRLYNLDPAFYKSLESNPFMRYSYQNHFDAGVGGMMYYSTNTEINPHDTYYYTRFSFDLSGNVLSMFKGMMKRDDNGNSLFLGTPFTQYVRGEWTAGYTFRYGEDNGQAIATRILAGVGYAYGNSSALPFEKQFYSGGANSMRGWQARSLGPGRSPVNETFSIPSQTGDLKLEANVEYRAKIFWKFEGAVFVDVGNVWAVNDEDALARFDIKDFYKSLAADWGLGLRCDLNFLVVRIDMGIKLYEPAYRNWRGPSQWLRNDGFSVHFGVGYPF